MQFLPFNALNKISLQVCLYHKVVSQHFVQLIETCYFNFIYLLIKKFGFYFIKICMYIKLYLNLRNGFQFLKNKMKFSDSLKFEVYFLLFC